MAESVLFGTVGKGLPPILSKKAAINTYGTIHIVSAPYPSLNTLPILRYLH